MSRQSDFNEPQDTFDSSRWLPSIDTFLSLDGITPLTPLETNIWGAGALNYSDRKAPALTPVEEDLNTTLIRDLKDVFFKHKVSTFDVSALLPGGEYFVYPSLGERSVAYSQVDESTLDHMIALVATFDEAYKSMAHAVQVSSRQRINATTEEREYEQGYHVPDVTNHAFANVDAVGQDMITEL